MIKTKNGKQYDLEERTFQFAKNTRAYCKRLPKTIINFDDVKQVLRSSGSVGANYIEANEALSKKDFLMRVKICRKEAKETIYWLNLLLADEEKVFQNESGILIKEAKELMMIFSSIMRKSEGKNPLV